MKTKEIIDIEFTEQKIDPDNDKIVIELRWFGVQEEFEEDIALANLIENYKSKLMMEFSQKSNWMIV